MLKFPTIKLGCLLIAFFGLSADILIAQDTCTLSLKGKVFDEHDGGSLPFATIFIQETGQFAQSNTDGDYEIESLCPGTYTIRCEHIGCEPTEFEIQLNNDLNFDFKLEHHTELLERIEVQAERSNQQHSQSSQEMDAVQLRKSGGETLAGMMDEISGVSILQTGPNIQKPVIHGLHSNRILILQNGIRQEDQQWGEEHAPQIDPYVAQSVTIVKGAASVQYGSGALGGVVLVEPGDLPFGDSLQGEINLAAFSNGRGGSISGILEGGWAKSPTWAWRVQGTFSKKGDIRSPDYFLTNTGSESNNFSATIGWQNDQFGIQTYYSRFDQSLGILRAAHIGNLTDLEDAIARGEPLIQDDFSYFIDRPKQEIEHHLIKTKAFWNTPKGGKLNLIYGLQVNNRDEFDRRRSRTDLRPSLDLQLFSNSLDLDYAHPLWKNWKGNFGVTGLSQVNFNVPGTGVRPLIPDYERQSLGLYWIERYLTNHWEFEFGFRYEFQNLLVKTFDLDGNLIKPQFQFHQYAGSIGFVFHVHDILDFRTNLSTAFRPPAVNELFSQGVHHGTASIEIGNPDLEVEKSLKWATDIQFGLSDFQARGVFFINRITDYIFLFPQETFELTIRGAFPVFNYEQTNAILWGSDWDFSYDLQSWIRLDAQYSMIRGRDIKADEDLIFLPADRYRGGFTIKPQVQNKHWQDLEFGVQVQYVDRQVRIPQNADFSAPPDAYTLVGLNASWSHPVGKSKALTIWLEAQNLFNTRYRDYLNRLRYFGDDPGRDIQLRIQFTF